ACQRNRGPRRNGGSDWTLSKGLLGLLSLSVKGLVKPIVAIDDLDIIPGFAERNSLHELSTIHKSSLAYPGFHPVLTGIITRQGLVRLPVKFSHQVGKVFGTQANVDGRVR